MGVQVNTHIFTAGQQAQASAGTVEKTAEPDHEKLEKSAKHEKEKLVDEMGETKEQNPKAAAKKAEKFREDPADDEVDMDLEEAVKKKQGQKGKKSQSDAAKAVVAESVSEKPIKRKKTG